MLSIKSGIMEYTLGDKLFYCKSADRYVLSKSKGQAEEVLKQLRLPFDGLEIAFRITEADTVIHRFGQCIDIVHCDKTVTADTIMVLGVPSTLDTSRRLKIIYRKPLNLHDNT